MSDSTASDKSVFQNAQQNGVAPALEQSGKAIGKAAIKGGASALEDSWNSLKNDFVSATKINPGNESFWQGQKDNFNRLVAAGKLPVDAFNMTVGALFNVPLSAGTQAIGETAHQLAPNISANLVSQGLGQSLWGLAPEKGGPFHGAPDVEAGPKGPQPSYAPKGDPTGGFTPVGNGVEAGPNPTPGRPSTVIKPDVTDIDEEGNIVGSSKPQAPVGAAEGPSGQALARIASPVAAEAPEAVLARKAQGQPEPPPQPQPAPQAAPEAPSPPLHGQEVEPSFRTTPAQIANEHAAEVSNLEAQGTADAFKSQANSEKPQPLQVYHGTVAPDAGLPNAGFLSKSMDLGPHFTTDVDTAQQFAKQKDGPNGRILPATLTPSKVLEMPDMLGWQPWAVANWLDEQGMTGYKGDGVKTLGELGDKALDASWGKGIVPGSDEAWSGANNVVKSWLKDKGYDAIKYKNMYEGKPVDTYIALDPNIVKPAQGLPAPGKTMAQPEAAPKGWGPAEGGPAEVPPPRDTTQQMMGYKAERPPTPKEQGMIDSIGDILGRIAPDAQANWYHKIRQGDYQINGAQFRTGGKGVIAWSLEGRTSGTSLENTVHHEALHFLRDMGYIKPDEWATLEQAAKDEDWSGKHQIEQRYRGAQPHIKTEEAIASEFGHWASTGAKPEGVVGKVFAKIKNFLDSVKAEFRKRFGTKATAEDIFKDIKSGRTGRREPNEAYGREAQTGAKPEEPLASVEGGGEGIPPDEAGGEGEEYEPPADQKALFGWIRGQEDALTRVRGENEADRTEALHYIENLPKELKDPDLNERLYHDIEGPIPIMSHEEARATGKNYYMTPEEKTLGDKYIMPIRQEANEIYNRLQKKGVKVGMDGYVHRIAKDRGSMYDPQEGPPSADAFNGGRGLGQKTASMKGRKMWMAEGADGSKTIVNGKFKVGDKVTGADGQTYKIRQATTKEIEEGSDVRYYKNAVANSLDNLLRLRRVERNVNYLEGLKQDPEFFGLASPPGSQMQTPAGWKATSLPQLRGWMMDPRIARMLDNFYEVGPQNDLGKVLAKVNRGLTSAIFINPVSALFGHGLNVATHWYVGRGWDNFLPHTWARSSVNAMKAFQDVMSLSPRYQQMLREGNSLMYAPVMNKDFHSTMIKLMGGEIKKDPKTWGQIAKMAGTSLPHLYQALSDVSSKGLWFANDVFMLQRVYDLMDKGEDVRTAITNAEHEIPNYRIPSEAWDGKGGAAFSELMSNPNLTIFGRYRYGLIHAYAKTVGDLTGKASGSGDRLKAAGQLLALGVLFGVLYPAGDKAVKWLTHNKHASMRRAGPTTVLAAVRGMMRGRPKGDDGGDFKNLMTGVSGLFGFAPGSEAIAEAAANTDFFTGKRIYNPNDPKNIPGQLGYFAASRPFPLQQGEELAEKRKNWPEIAASWLGIEDPSQKEFNTRRHYAQLDYDSDKKAWNNKVKALERAGKAAYHSVFGVGE